MHILFLTDNFPPEVNAPATRTYEHAITWVKLGHKVTVVTGAPNFPEGKLFSGYRNRWYQCEDLNGIRVVRVKTYITANQGFAKRILDYLSFMVMGFIGGLFQKKPDIIVATSPQFFTAIGGYALSLFKRKKFVFEVRDIWPASITAVGAMKNSLALNILEKIELFLYRQADQIVVVTNAFKRELVARGVDKNKIHVVLNGVDLKRYLPSEVKDQSLLKQYDLDGKFIVGYIGTHGLAHGLEHILCAAQSLSEREEIKILFVGGGAARQELEQSVRDKGLKNVVLIPRQPKELMPQIWSLCDISLVSLRNTPLFETVIPSKIFESMGMGVPMILTMPTGEATEIIQKLNAGVVVAPEAPDDLANVVIELVDNPKYLKYLAKNAAASAHLYSREQLAREMIAIFDRGIR